MAVNIRFNHMELSVPSGTLTDGFRADLEAFYGDVFGFSFQPGRMFEQDTHLMTLPDGPFILVIEAERPMAAPGFDHLGFEMQSRDQVDETRAKVRAWTEKDARVQLKEYPDGVMDGRLYHAYYVRHLLPIWFDVQYSSPVG